MPAMCWVYHQWLAFKMICVFLHGFSLSFTYSLCSVVVTNGMRILIALGKKDARQKLNEQVDGHYAINATHIHKTKMRAVIVDRFFFSSFHFVPHVCLSLNFWASKPLMKWKKKPSSTTTKATAIEKWRHHSNEDNSLLLVPR